MDRLLVVNSFRERTVTYSFLYSYTQNSLSRLTLLSEAKIPASEAVENYIKHSDEHHISLPFLPRASFVSCTDFLQFLTQLASHLTLLTREPSFIKFTNLETKQFFQRFQELQLQTREFRQSPPYCTTAGELFVAQSAG